MDSKLPAAYSIPEQRNHISVSIVNDREIQVLNAQYRNKNKPTDVLSFSLAEGAQGLFPSPSLGDLVVSSETTLRQAKEYRVTPYQELLRLLIHGSLHLCGYDHEGVPANEAQAMRRMEQRVFEQICNA